MGYRPSGEQQIIAHDKVYKRYCLPCHPPDIVAILDMLSGRGEINYEL